VVDDEPWFAPQPEDRQGDPARARTPMGGPLHWPSHLVAAAPLSREWGVDAQLYRDGDLVIDRRFHTRAEAVEWAEAQRAY